MRLPEIVARRAKHRYTAFSVAPEIAVNNTWSDRHSVIEVSGLDRPGLLYDLTNTLSRLNLNIASAHVATFGERAVDVFYVTDLTGGKIRSVQRTNAIRKALLQLFEKPAEPAKPAKRARAAR
jgi:[protein-PII] uridylyltransferase